MSAPTELPSDKAQQATAWHKQKWRKMKFYNTEHFSGHFWYPKPTPSDPRPLKQSPGVGLGVGADRQTCAHFGPRYVQRRFMGPGPSGATPFWGAHPSSGEGAHAWVCKGATTGAMGWPPRGTPPQLCNQPHHPSGGRGAAQWRPLSGIQTPQSLSCMARCTLAPDLLHASHSPKAYNRRRSCGGGPQTPRKPTAKGWQALGIWSAASQRRLGLGGAHRCTAALVFPSFLNKKRDSAHQPMPRGSVSGLSLRVRSRAHPSLRSHGCNLPGIASRELRLRHTSTRMHSPQACVRTPTHAPNAL